MPKNVIVKSPESASALSVNGTVYDLQIAPEYTDFLVVEQKKELLQQIDLNELTDNLYLSVELLFVAYNGVAGAQGGKLQAEINDLTGQLALLCNKCVVTMLAFQTETRNIVSELGQTFRFLTTGKEKLAVAKIKHCGESSAKMATSANGLSEDFMTLQQRSVAVRSSAITEEASETDKKLAAQQAQRELLAKQKAEKANQEELVEQVAQVQTLYNEAKSREESAANKALITGIVSSISGAIGAGLGAFAAAKNPVGTALSKLPSGEEGKKLDAAQKIADDKKAQSDKANNDLLAVNDKLVLAKGKLTTLKKEEADLTTQINILTGVQEDARTPAQQDELKELTAKRAAKTEALNTADEEVKMLTNQGKQVEKSAKDLTAEYGAAAAAFQSLTTSTDKMASAAASAEESIHAEKMKFLEKKFELEAAKRKSLVSMVEFAEGIKNAQVTEGNAEVSVNSLHAAVEAMGKIVGTLTNASLFWKQMAAFCTKMTDQGFQANLRDLIDPSVGLTAEERIEEYQDAGFMMSFLSYTCQWVALNGLSGEYLVGAANAQKKCVENMAKSPSIAEAKRDAPRLAKAMAEMLNQKIFASTTASSGILQEQARLSAVV